MKNFLQILLLGFVAFSCASTKNTQSTSNEFSSNLVIKQNGNEFTIDASDQEILLEKSPFTCEFNLQKYDAENAKFYAASIAITDDSLDLKFFQEGPIASDNPYYSIGTGNAANDNEEYSSIYLQGNGHHHVFYADENHKRAMLIEKLDKEHFRVKWDINSITYFGDEYTMNAILLKEAYLMFFNDANLNDVIESGEYHRVKIGFK